jgi:hypothetical protein
MAVEDTSNGSFGKHVVNEVRLSQVISAFHERYGKSSPLKAAAHVSMGETCLVRNVSFGFQWYTNTLNVDYAIFPISIAQSPRKFAQERLVELQVSCRSCLTT